MITETLFFPYRKERLTWPGADDPVLFVNAEYASIIRGLSLTVVQPKYHLALPFIQAGHAVLPDVPNATFDTIWILPGKDMQETQYLLARAVMAAKPGATIVAAAANTAGGQRLAEMFAALGLDATDDSKNKARVTYATVSDYNKTLAAQWAAAGAEQRLASGMISRPGLHSWDKIDDGSAILAKYLSDDISGHVADFGCGWGFLSLSALQTSPDISHLTMVDVDARAVSIAEKNLQGATVPVTAVWEDLARPEMKLGPFDAILLNPPFHDGTTSDPGLGLAIIATARRSLKPGGRLYLVANRHLPYEKPLKTLFSHVSVLVEEGGFKALLCRP